MNQQEPNTINILSELYTILEETKIVLENDLLCLYRIGNEQHPDDITFTWDTSLLTDSNKPDTILAKPKITAKEKNFACKLCSQKMMGLPNFKREGSIPILVLHYTGEFRKGQPQFIKKNRTLIFRNDETEDLFSRMFQKSMNINYKSMFFQEFPACTFNHNVSTDLDWKNRTIQCSTFVKETIKENNIRGIILMGAAAVLYLGKEDAKQKADRISEFEFDGIKIPGIVLRSPDALLAMEAKKKELSKDKNSDAYKKALEEEKTVKLQIVEQLKKLKSELQL